MCECWYTCVRASLTRPLPLDQNSPYPYIPSHTSPSGFRPPPFILISTFPPPPPLPNPLFPNRQIPSKPLQGNTKPRSIITDISLLAGAVEVKCIYTYVGLEILISISIRWWLETGVDWGCARVGAKWGFEGVRETGLGPGGGGGEKRSMVRRRG